VAALYIALDRRDAGFEAHVNGMAVSDQADELETLAHEAGIAAPFDFFSASDEDIETLSDFDDIDDDFVSESGGGSEEQWFSAEEGLHWVAALRDAIEKSPELLSDPEAVLEDLGEYETVFTQAREVGVNWHFAVDN